MKKTAFAVLMLTAVLIAVVSVFSVVSAAEENGTQGDKVLSYSVPGHSEEEAASYAAGLDDRDGVYIFNMNEGTWYCRGISTRQEQLDGDGGLITVAYLPENSGASHQQTDGKYITFVMNMFKENIDLGGSAELGFGIAFGDAPAGAAYKTEVEVVTSGGIRFSEQYVTADDAGGYTMIYTDLRGVGGMLYEVHITVRFGDEKTPGSATITSPYLHGRISDGFTYSKKYMTDRLYAEGGAFTMETGVATPDNVTSIVLTGRTVTLTEFENGGDVFFNITLSGIKAGTMTLGVTYRDFSGGKAVMSNKISIFSGEHTYTVPVKAHGDIASYTLRFDSIQCDGSFCVDSVDIYTSSYSILAADSSVGRVSLIERNGNTVRFEGELERSAISDYSTDIIHFFAVPSPFSGIEDAIEIGNTKISTRFSYSADVSEYPLSVETYAFFVGVVRSDGEIVPISSPEYCKAGTAADSAVSNVGLYDAATVGAFESNASHVITDISLNELITDGSDPRDIAVPYNVYTLVQDGKPYATKNMYFSHTLLDVLDRDINFYATAGIKVYLRFTASSPVRGLTYSSSKAENYSVNPTSANARQMYAATVKYLVNRYNTIDGIVVGKSLNSNRHVGRLDMDDPAHYAAEAADLCRITYNVLSEYSGGAIVIIPFEEDRNDGKQRVSASIISVMMAAKLTEIGQMPWTYMYITEDISEIITLPDETGRTLGELGLGAQNNNMYFLEPDKATLVSKYAGYVTDRNVSFGEYVAFDFGRICSDYPHARAVFLSLTDADLRNDHEFYSSLKNSSQSGGFVFESLAEQTIDTSADGRYVIWDFSDKYYPLGWRAGGGVSSCLTEYSETFSENKGGSSRVLHTEFVANEYGVSGITLCNFKDTVDLRSVDKIDFSFALLRSGKSSEHFSMNGITVVFVVGTDDYRAEYYADRVSLNDVHEYSCDLTKYTNRNAVDYIGIVVYSDYNIYLELSDVTLYSSSLTGGEIEELFLDKATETEKKTSLVLIPICIVIAALTFTVFILLVRHEKEENTKKETNNKTNKSGGTNNE